jgi:hypothetical protein
MKSLLLGSIALVLVSCGTEANPTLLGCFSDDACPDQVCSLDTHQCVPIAARTSGIEVVRPNISSQGNLNVMQTGIAQEFPQIAIGVDGRLTLKLEDPVSLQGQVYASDTSLPIASRITAIRDSLLPGRGKVQVDVSFPPAGRDGTGPFGIWLNRGQSYTFVVMPIEPNDAEYPPLVVSGITLDSHTSRDFVLEGKDRAVEVAGNVVDNVGNNLPYPVRVRAYRPGGLYHSTMAKSDQLKEGAFSFRVPPGVFAYNVAVETHPSGKPIPTMVCTNAVLGLIPADKTQQPIGKLALPAFLAPENYTVQVVGKPETSTTQQSTDPVAVANAMVTFTTTLTGARNEGFDDCVSTYEQTAITDSAGKIAIPLVRVNDNANQIYSVRVIAPARSPFASQYVAKLDVGKPVGTTGSVLKVIVLDRRYWVKGRVVSGGKGVASTTIEAQQISTGTTSELPTTRVSAITDSEGKFELYCDPGVHNLDFRPPAGLGLPSFGITAVKIDGNSEDRLFEVPSPQALAGRVLDPKGQQASDVQVRIYDLVPETTTQPLTQKALLRGSSTTDALGAFYVLLPNPAK